MEIGREIIKLSEGKGDSKGLEQRKCYAQEDKEYIHIFRLRKCSDWRGFTLINLILFCLRPVGDRC